MDQSHSVDLCAVMCLSISTLLTSGGYFLTNSQSRKRCYGSHASRGELIGCQEDMGKPFSLMFNLLQCMLFPGSNNFKTVFNHLFLLLHLLLFGQLFLLCCYGPWPHTIKFYPLACLPIYMTALSVFHQFQQGLPIR